jgi:mRNA interferase YafQ
VLTPVRSGRFRRDVKQAEKRGKDMAKLKAVLLLLIEKKPLPASYKDHPLKGDWKGFRDLHIEPDWLLLYRVEGNELQLARTGTHADLFDE